MNNGSSNTSNNCCDNCVAEILHVIKILQDNACPENCLNSCDRPALGGGTNSIVFNTRPIMLYTCCGNGVPWSMPTTRTEEGVTSSVFRVEKINGCCCTFRVLAPNPDTTSIYPYVSTDSIFTMDVGCMCAVRCLNDTYVECL